MRVSSHRAPGCNLGSSNTYSGLIESGLTQASHVHELAWFVIGLQDVKFVQVRDPSLGLSKRCLSSQRRHSFAGHPLAARFARLTRQEGTHGLLDDTATIGTRDGWERRLAQRGFMVRGHRLVRRREERRRGGTTKLTEWLRVPSILFQNHCIY